MAAHTIEADDLLIYAEVRVGDSTVMSCDAQPDWPFTPALLQVYVGDVDAVCQRARAHGAAVFTEPTGFFGEQRLARDDHRADAHPACAGSTAPRVTGGAVSGSPSARCA